MRLSTCGSWVMTASLGVQANRHNERIGPLNIDMAQDPVNSMAGRGHETRMIDPDQEAVFALLADPATHAGAAVKRIDTHAAVGVPGRRARAEGQARGALSVPRLFDAREAQGRLRGRARGQPAVCAGNLSRRRADHARGRMARSRSAATATPVEWAVEMRRFDENATLDHLADAGKIDAALADALGRAVAAAHAAAPAVEAAPWIAALADYIEQNDAAFRAMPELFPPGAVEALTEREPRRARAHPPAPARARRARPHPPRPWRPASRQHRADRRAAGAVRRHRVRSADRLGRRALRSRLPADGSRRARPRGRRQHRVQPLPDRDRGAPRTSTRSPRCRCFCRCARRSAPR